MRFEPQQAEALWLRARAVDPEAKPLTLATGVRSGPQYWSFQLGSLYAQVLIGSTSPSDGRPLTPMGSDPYSVDVRRRLAASDDARMLVAAGQQLVRVYLGGERTELGIQLLERAVQLDPIDRTAVGLLARARGAQRDRQIRERLSARVIELASPDLAQKIRNRSPLSADELRERRELEVQALDGLSSDDRLVLLPQMAANDYMRAEAEAHSGKDRAAVDASFARSKHFAARALDTAETMRGSTEYPMAVYQSTVTLALHLLREGDRREAVRLMTIASEGPSATQSIPYFGLGGRLVNSMLNAGERESVAVFLERSARLLPAEAERLAGDAAAIRAGRMPLSYQYLMAQ